MSFYLLHLGSAARLGQPCSRMRLSVKCGAKGVCTIVSARYPPICNAYAALQSRRVG